MVLWCLSSLFTGNFTKVALGKKQNKASSEVISFLKLTKSSKHRDLHWKTAEVVSYSPGITPRLLKLPSKRPRQSGERGKLCRRQHTGKIALINHRITMSRHETIYENYIPLLLPTKSLASTHTSNYFIFQVEHQHLFDLWLCLRRGKKAFPAYVREHCRVKGERKTWLPRSVSSSKLHFIIPHLNKLDVSGGVWFW